MDVEMLVVFRLRAAVANAPVGPWHDRAAYRDGTRTLL